MSAVYHTYCSNRARGNQMVFCPCVRLNLCHHSTWLLENHLSTFDTVSVHAYLPSSLETHKRREGILTRGTMKKDPKSVPKRSVPMEPAANHGACQIFLGFDMLQSRSLQEPNVSSPRSPYCCLLMPIQQTGPFNNSVGSYWFCCLSLCDS